MWYKVKEKLPESGQIVLIKLKLAHPFLAVARYLDNLTSLADNYKNIFILIVHPRFPKTWLFDERYKKNI